MGVYHLRPELLLLAELNHRNNLAVPITLEMVTFGVPEDYPLGNTNTRVWIGAVPDNEYYRSGTYLYYNRWELSRLLSGLVVPGQPSDYATTVDVATRLAEDYRLPLQARDIDDVPLDGQSVVTLHARSDSLGFRGTVELSFRQA